MSIRYCNKCGVELTDKNWRPSAKRGHNYKCKQCLCDYENDRKYRLKICKPFSKNKNCPAFLGIYVAEQVLSNVFKDVEVMPVGNPGFDIICNQGKLIDIKSACRDTHGESLGCWRFYIKHNQIADYFLCLAFDNRADLTPLHLWLLPAGKFNHLTSTSISISTIHKWDEYRLDIGKVMSCCDTMKDNHAKSNHQQDQ